LYPHMFTWPFDSVLRVPAIENEVLAAHMMSLPGQPALSVERDTVTGEIMIQLPTAEPNDYATVIMLDVQGQVAASPMVAVPNQDGALILQAGRAEIVGNTLRYVPQQQSLGHWTNVQDRAQWHIRIDQPGTYQVRVTYGCEPASAGGTYAVTLDNSRLTAQAQSTNGWFERRTDDIGQLQVNEAGMYTLEISLVEKPGVAVFDLKQVELRFIE